MKPPNQCLASFHGKLWNRLKTTSYLIHAYNKNSGGKVWQLFMTSVFGFCFLGLGLHQQKSVYQATTKPPQKWHGLQQCQKHETRELDPTIVWRASTTRHSWVCTLRLERNRASLLLLTFQTLLGEAGKNPHVWFLHGKINRKWWMFYFQTSHNIRVV